METGVLTNLIGMGALTITMDNNVKGYHNDGKSSSNENWERVDTKNLADSAHLCGLSG